MTAFLCDHTIEFDATRLGYQAKDVERLIADIRASGQAQNNGKIVVFLKNAHYLTTKAFSVLYNYIRQEASQNVVFVVSGDKSKIFPPLLEWLESD